MKNIIEIEKLSKNFLIPKKSKGFTNIFKPEYKEIKAVNKISFNIKQGERVAFIGPNGAGKSTTIKMLSSILHPTSGSAKVLGLTPWENRKQLSFEIGTVFGQRSQLWYDLPIADSFYLIGKIYNVDNFKLKRRIAHLVRLFEIRDLLNHPTKSLSLGQRMRCEIVASLIHNPKVLFLDEPTIGLDITAKAIIRDLIKKQTIEEDTTLLLTSHDTDDMEKVCDRVIIINKGKLIFDDTIKHLKDSYLKKKYIEGTTDTGDKITTIVDTTQTPIRKAIDDLMKKHNILDITVENPPMEEIIEEIYNSND